MEISTTQFLEALEHPDVVNRFQLMLEPMFKAHLDPLSSQLKETVKTLPQTVTTLKAEVKAKDDCIRALQDNVEELQTRVDDLEQQGRKDSVRIFGLPEVDSGTTDEKVTKLCNERMKLEPPLALEAIAVSHRLGLQRTPEDAAAVPPPRPLLVKFVSRRSKQRVMEVRKNLRVPKNTGIMEVDDSQAASSPEIQAGDLQPPSLPIIYITDDLTQLRAKLAYHARVSKRDKNILDTWVTNGKIMVKNLHGRISQVKYLSELEKVKSEWKLFQHFEVYVNWAPADALGINISRSSADALLTKYSVHQTIKLHSFTDRIRIRKLSLDTSLSLLFMTWQFFKL